MALGRCRWDNPASRWLWLEHREEIVYFPLFSEADFCDWSKFADEWLETKLWPES